MTTIYNKSLNSFRADIQPMPTLNFFDFPVDNSTFLLDDKCVKEFIKIEYSVSVWEETRWIFDRMQGRKKIEKE